LNVIPQTKQKQQIIRADSLFCPAISLSQDSEAYRRPGEMPAAYTLVHVKAKHVYLAARARQ
jgi:hypothetical protein